MGEMRRAESASGLYERLLHRLALALDEADTAIRLRDEDPRELELKGLSPAELELIRAYLDNDLHWLRGWHAAAEELALIEQQPAKSKLTRTAAKTPAASPRVAKPLFKRRQQLVCALCGAAASWQRGQGVQACPACGSQLFRTGNPR
ncbi:hypothetical protein thsps21_54880 [Pseudomonas sp. No.21]|jgi:DNA-directed RNA polymerase subunit RPC12/RpoP|uniref:hypothetical protein n=1 Tax=Pseudomonas TaxID=286 RepID=UPI000DAA28C0|nr:MULTISPECIES: hypothetical protein [Pseudomonas]MDW3715160.1 hypothetical protein [Pseudomonas sp. 2023EL-01195]PZE12938.1 hypothetical protein DMX10_13285 [Pseudomonas sp. 57B-090624]GJN48961.1 hypothetical protein TUM20249_49470 [Pseudomonas tohonis]